MKFKTKQEDFWFGEFGNSYIPRNKNAHLIAGNTAVFSKIVGRTCNVKSLIEFGAGSGNNLVALKTLLPDLEMTAVEINKQAVSDLKKLGKNLKIYNQSLFEFKTKKRFDFVLSKGVLIHINPAKLQTVYKIYHEVAQKYICLMEYYNPSPIELEYRGHQGYLFKRDFAGEMLDLYSDLKLVDYGFIYRRDPNFSLDDISWFLLEKIKK